MGTRSAAIQIRPPASPCSGSSGMPSVRLAKSSAGDRAVSPRLPPICRNVLVHGNCKYEKEGCRFTHPTSNGSLKLSSPKAAAAALPAAARDAPVFVPGGNSGSASVSTSPKLTNPEAAPFVARLSTQAPEFAPGKGVEVGEQANHASGDIEHVTEWYGDLDINGSRLPYEPIDPHQSSLNSYGGSVLYPAVPGPPPPGPPTSYTLHGANADQDPGFIGEYGGVGGIPNYRPTLNYHLYAPPLPHTSNQHPHQAAANSFFLPHPIRETLQKRSEAILQTPTHEVARSPSDLGVYHTLLVLSSPPSGGAPSSQSFGYPTWIYKAFCTLDGKAYALLRLEGYQLTEGKTGRAPGGGMEGSRASAAIGEAGRWRKVRHPGVVSVREAFTTRAFGDHSLVFVYDYHPSSQTLLEAHLTPKPPTRDPRTGRYQPQVSGVSERVLWSYIVQIANAMRAVHLAGFAVRTIEPSKVLLTGQNRVRLNGSSVRDVLTYEHGGPAARLSERQQEDLVALGRLICALGCTSLSAPNNLVKAVEALGRTYSLELKDVTVWLLQPPGPKKSVMGLIERLSGRMWDELAAAFGENDLLEGYLMRELENGRLVRLMAKFGFINERPEFDHDPQWAETGDRYLIKLFRDYVFHQVDELGRPVTDLSHVLTCLNKLDAAVEEKICLVSRDEQTCLVVSYAEIRRCVDVAFRDLSKR